MKDHWGYDNEKKPDIVEVVRCKYCKHWMEDSVFKTGWCNNKHRVMETSKDWFCADGKRRNE